MGAGVLNSPLFKMFKVFARLLFTPEDFYRYTNRPGRGGGNILFGCIEPSVLALSNGHMVLELNVKPGYETCREFFIMSDGGLRVMPKLCGYAEATVHMKMIERGAHYDVTYPVARSGLRRFRNFLASPFTFRAVARELVEANEVLQTRYEEIERARATLDRQATQLRTAHSISQLMHSDLDLASTADAIARALVSAGGFSGAAVHLSLTTADRPASKSSTAGQVTVDKPAFSVPVRSREQQVGELQLWCHTDADLTERDALLQFVIPSVSMALDDAIAFTNLSDLRNNLEQKVVERTVDLQGARDALQQTVQNLREVQESRDRMFANVNHEFRTPLAIVMLAATEIRRRLASLSSSEVESHLDAIDRSVRKLMRQVDMLLVLAAREEGKLSIEVERFDLQTLLVDLVAAFRPAADKAFLKLTLNVSGATSMVADPGAVEQMVANLLSNAVKFTPAGGFIQIDVTQNSTSTEIIVCDSGVGIDDEFRARIFGRFEQGRPSVSPGVRGSGIGLSIVRELVEAHQGTIEVGNRDGGGSRFTLNIPTMPEVIGAESHFSVTSAPSDFGLSNSVQESAVFGPAKSVSATILLIEDDPALGPAIAKVLAEDYRVIWASDGETGLKLAQEKVPDILVSDIGLPGMDGLELTRRFRQVTNNRLAPVILITAYAGLKDRLAGFEAGAVDYLVKPFEPQELKARIRSQLELRTLALKLHRTEKLAALGTLSAGLAHEMRNPANAIVNAIEPLMELLPAELIDPSQPAGQLLTVVRDCAEQVAVLSRQLLGFRKGGELERHQIPFSQVYSRALALLQPALTEIELRENLEYLGPISCAAPLFTQVLSNLIENATHATVNGGRPRWVAVSTRREDDTFVFEVADSGPGVPVEIRERIFEPFFTTKSPGAGTGLGLTTSREIVERHGGSLDVRESKGGTTFRIELPLDIAAKLERSHNRSHYHGPS